MYSKGFGKKIKKMKDGLQIIDGYVLLTWNGAAYDIALDRISTPEQLLGWVFHLAGKTWMDINKIRYFVGVIADRNGWEIHGV